MSKIYQINVCTIEDIKKLNGLFSKLNSDVDAISGRYIVDAKSIMGLFTLDLSKPFGVRINTSNKDEEYDFITIISDYIVNTEI